ncbi:MAG TPA: DUF4142 domain-containing protein [Cyclobacteriaceae bacterium]|nr:DUF4142 domain-containing protein [Cyclobacteriaceae bacterium]
MEKQTLGIVAFLVFSVCGVNATAQELAFAKNDVGSGKEEYRNTVIDADIEYLIVTLATARMISAEEGRLAAEKGTTEEIREFGELAIKDHGRLLGEIKRLAVIKNIALPDDINENDLGEKSGKQFNNTFIRNMIGELERDIKLFREAKTSGDPDVSMFASDYLPVLESHLKKIKAIRKG